MGIVLGFLLYSNSCLAEPSRYHLDIRFLPEQQTLLGKATINIPSGKEWHLYTGGMEIQEIILKEEGKASFTMPLPRKNSIGMYASDSNLQVTIRYSLKIPENTGDNLIGSRGIVLTSNWHPQPQENMLFSLTATLPQGFQGISESDTLPKQTTDGTMSSSFSQPVRSIHLAAGPYQVEQETIREGLILSTWFFNEDQELSRGYLDAAKAYILRYEKEIGPFPYDHYAIVANRLPSGLGMPTFTLLGQVVLRLPFIKETSLGHEILHSWFGNSTQVADNSGNWCEGLTSYLADFSYAADRGDGISHRKAALTTYQSFVHPNSAMPLIDFSSASHNQPLAKAKRAVGYSRSAMMFHQLRGIMGPEYFVQSLRLFASSFKGKAASWQDLQTVFETTSGKDLTQFFKQQLTRKDVPTLQVTNIRTQNKQDTSILDFTISQATKQPYTLMIPIRVKTMSGSQDFIREITEQKTAISISLSSPPLSFTVDPDYELFRRLTVSEFPPVWSRFIGAEHKLLIVGKDQEQSPFAPFIKWAEQQDWTVIDDESVSNQQLSENSLLFLGTESAAFKSLFGGESPAQEGFQITVQNNPLNKKEVSVLARSSSDLETTQVVHKLNHYGKYSSLSFEKGRIRQKEITPSSNGIEYQLERLPRGGSAATMDTFDQVITELAKKRVIYLGETHNSLADHLLQLRIIQGLHQKGLDLAIGMEMFPASSQQALDDYLLAKSPAMDEAEFLRASRWFSVWRYDWRLFRPIFNFLRQNSIPVYGINIERKIVSSVFTDGNTDALSPEQTETIAKERDLAVEGYVERLSQVYQGHTKSPHGKDKGISGFVQSQAIWDESMAENIATIFQKDPKKTVVVIAGNQHTRKDSGIPPRLARRIDLPQASVLNLYANSPPMTPSAQADFFFLAAPLFLEAKGIIGIILDPKKDENDQEFLRVKGVSHAGKAKDAGIKEDDIIATINGQAVKNMEDIGILMLDSRVGDILKMTLLRKDPSGEQQEKEISVELSSPTKPLSHP